jgi:hypothetical protein
MLRPVKTNTRLSLSLSLSLSCLCNLVTFFMIMPRQTDSQTPDRRFSRTLMRVSCCLSNRWQGIECRFAADQSRVIVLSVDNVDLAGQEIPWGPIGRLTALEELSLRSCGLSGPIAAESLCRLQNLKALGLSENHLRGQLPACISTMSLDWLWLGSNELRGPLSELSALGESLKMIPNLALADNRWAPLLRQEKQVLKDVFVPLQLQGQGTHDWDFGYSYQYDWNHSVETPHKAERAESYRRFGSGVPFESFSAVLPFRFPFQGRTVNSMGIAQDGAFGLHSELRVHHVPESECHNDPHTGYRVCGAASMSSSAWGGEPGRTIDNRPEDTLWGKNSCSHGGAPPGWFQVDLGDIASINHVAVWHRTDCCQTRLEGALVYVSETPDFTSGELCGGLSDHTHAPEISQCDELLDGRYVTVYVSDNPVQICEMKVYGFGDMALAADAAETVNSDHVCWESLASLVPHVHMITETPSNAQADRLPNEGSAYLATKFCPSWRRYLYPSSGMSIAAKVTTRDLSGETHQLTADEATPDASIQACAHYCGSANGTAYRYMGLQGADDCYCGNSYGNRGAGQTEDSRCDFNGDSSPDCGTGAAIQDIQDVCDSVNAVFELSDSTAPQYIGCYDDDDVSQVPATASCLDICKTENDIDDAVVDLPDFAEGGVALDFSPQSGLMQCNHFLGERTGRWSTHRACGIGALYTFADCTACATEHGNMISDGGGDMYDGGNILTTSLMGSCNDDPNECALGSLHYYDNYVPIETNCFGRGGSYKMHRQEGLWVFFTQNVHSRPIDFMVLGNKGSDGIARTSEFVFQSAPWIGFVKTSCGAADGDASVNHMIIVDDSEPLASHSCDFTNGGPCTGANDNLDDDVISGIHPGSSVLFLLYSTQAGTCMSEADHQAIFEIAVRRQKHSRGRIITSMCPCIVSVAPISLLTMHGITGTLHGSRRPVEFRGSTKSCQHAHTYG